MMSGGENVMSQELLERRPNLAQLSVKQPPGSTPKLPPGTPRSTKSSASTSAFADPESAVMIVPPQSTFGMKTPTAAAAPPGPPQPQSGPKQQPPRQSPVKQQPAAAFGLKGSGGAPRASMGKSGGLVKGGGSSIDLGRSSTTRELLAKMARDRQARQSSAGSERQPDRRSEAIGIFPLDASRASIQSFKSVASTPRSLPSQQAGGRPPPAKTPVKEQPPAAFYRQPSAATSLASTGQHSPRAAQIFASLPELAGLRRRIVDSHGAVARWAQKCLAVTVRANDHAAEASGLRAALLAVDPACEATIDSLLEHCALGAGEGGPRYVSVSTLLRVFSEGRAEPADKAKHVTIQSVSGVRCVASVSPGESEADVLAQVSSRLGTRQSGDIQLLDGDGRPVAVSYAALRDSGVYFVQTKPPSTAGRSASNSQASAPESDPPANAAQPPSEGPDTPGEPAGRVASDHARGGVLAGGGQNSEAVPSVDTVAQEPGAAGGEGAPPHGEGGGGVDRLDRSAGGGAARREGKRAGPQIGSSSTVDFDITDPSVDVVSPVLSTSGEHLSFSSPANGPATIVSPMTEALGDERTGDKEEPTPPTTVQHAPAGGPGRKPSSEAGAGSRRARPGGRSRSDSGASSSGAGRRRFGRQGSAHSAAARTGSGRAGRKANSDASGSTADTATAGPPTPRSLPVVRRLRSGQWQDQQQPGEPPAAEAYPAPGFEAGNSVSMTATYDRQRLPRELRVSVEDLRADVTTVPDTESEEPSESGTRKERRHSRNSVPEAGSTRKERRHSRNSAAAAQAQVREEEQPEAGNPRDERRHSRNSVPQMLDKEQSESGSTRDERRHSRNSVPQMLDREQSEAGSTRNERRYSTNIVQAAQQMHDRDAEEPRDEPIAISSLLNLSDVDKRDDKTDRQPYQSVTSQPRQPPKPVQLLHQSANSVNFDPHPTIPTATKPTTAVFREPSFRSSPFPSRQAAVLVDRRSGYRQRQPAQNGLDDVSSPALGLQPFVHALLDRQTAEKNYGLEWPGGGGPGSFGCAFRDNLQIERSKRGLPAADDSHLEPPPRLTAPPVDSSVPLYLTANEARTPNPTPSWPYARQAPDPRSSGLYASTRTASPPFSQGGVEEHAVGGGRASSRKRRPHELEGADWNQKTNVVYVSTVSLSATNGEPFHERGAETATSRLVANSPSDHHSAGHAVPKAAYRNRNPRAPPVWNSADAYRPTAASQQSTRLSPPRRATPAAAPVSPPASPVTVERPVDYATIPVAIRDCYVMRDAAAGPIGAHLTGVSVERVTEGTPAHKAGLRAGMIVHAVNGRPVLRFEDVQESLASSGSKVAVFSVSGAG
ncbi:hypothetical protein DIPPA_28747 [Diplonema papillatum]|nr:hypothetical protein DIPPA_28747 [Diplonema papillatum]